MREEIEDKIDVFREVLKEEEILEDNDNYGSTPKQAKGRLCR